MSIRNRVYILYFINKKGSLCFQGFVQLQSVIFFQSVFSLCTPKNAFSPIVICKPLILKPSKNSQCTQIFWKYLGGAQFTEVCVCHARSRISFQGEGEGETASPDHQKGTATHSHDHIFICTHFFQNNLGTKPTARYFLSVDKIHGTYYFRCRHKTPTIKEYTTT